MLTRERRSLASSPTLPEFGRTGRKGASRPSLPPAVRLPPLTSALSRRAALFGAVTVAGFTTEACTPAKGQDAALSAKDARLVAIAEELQAVHDRCTTLSASHRPAEDLPEWDALLDRFGPLEDEMAETPADSMAGVVAKAQALQVPTVASCLNGIGDSLAADLVRLQVEGALS